MQLRKAMSRLSLAFGLLALALGPSVVRADEAPVRLAIVGGLAGVSQYTRLEQPFWESEIGRLSQGRITATIRPLDAGALRGQEMLQLMRLGVVPMGTALLAVVAGDEPELNAIDLPALNPDMATLRQTVARFRDHLAAVLRERYDITLLGVYTYPAQVLFCARPFTGLADLHGRRVRTSSVGQSELVTALGAVAVLLPFNETVPALRDGIADCAITGTLSGYEVGLPAVTTHVHAMALSWGVSIFAANRPYWDSLPADVRATIEQGVGDLERRIWAQAEADTLKGLACNTGRQPCGPPLTRPMTVVPASPEDQQRRRRLLAGTVLPRWIERCGGDCLAAWSRYLQPLHGVAAAAEAAPLAPRQP